MPQNKLAPPLQNSLAYSVPVPLEPGMLRPAPRVVPRRELENLSIGLGRGLTAGLEGTKQLLTQPVATARALVEAARQMGTDPGIVLEMLRAARQKAMSGSLGLGELIGENLTPGVRNRAPMMQRMVWPEPESAPRGAKLVFMSPQEYLDQVAAIQKTRFENLPHPVKNEKTIEKLRKAIRANESIETPWLTVKKGKIVDQEGRHRATAALQEGVEQIPVFIYEK
jgi:hypothetical protein